MTDKKKHYVSPAIETEQIDLPQAWACSYAGANATGTGEPCWVGSLSELIRDLT